MRNALENLDHLADKSDLPFTDDERQALEALDTHRAKFIRAMDDDLNTADAIASIFELISDVNKRTRGSVSKEYAAGARALLLELANVLGLLEEHSGDGSLYPDHGDGVSDAELQEFIDERAKARAEKNWARADEIRDLLLAKGIVLKDTPQGVQIIREKN